MRRAQWGAVVAAMAIGTFVAIPAAPSGAVVTPNDVTIVKVVDGTAPDGTVFKVVVECDNAPGETVYFDENGDPSDKNGDSDPGSNVVSAAATDTCTVNETVDGGATSVSYNCDDENSENTECSNDDQEVTFSDVTGSEATVTVTNTFEAPTTTTTTPPTTTTLAPKPTPAPAPVVAAARFTG